MSRNERREGGQEEEVVGRFLRGVGVGGGWRLVGKKSSGWWPPAEAVWQGISLISLQSEAPFLGSVILDVSSSSDASNAALKTASGLAGENWAKLAAQINTGELYASHLASWESHYDGVHRCVYVWEGDTIKS